MKLILILSTLFILSSCSSSKDQQNERVRGKSRRITIDDSVVSLTDKDSTKVVVFDDSNLDTVSLTTCSSLRANFFRDATFRSLLGKDTISLFNVQTKNKGVKQLLIKADDGHTERAFSYSFDQDSKEFFDCTDIDNKVLVCDFDDETHELKSVRSDQILSFQFAELEYKLENLTVFGVFSNAELVTGYSDILGDERDPIVISSFVLDSRNNIIALNYREDWYYLICP